MYIEKKPNQLTIKKIRLLYKSYITCIFDSIDIFPQMFEGQSFCIPVTLL